MSGLDCDPDYDPARGYVALPPAIFDLDLTPGAFRALAELCRMADASGRSWPSLAQLGARLGRARATVSAYVDELRAAGLVTTETQRTATGYNYRLRYTVTFWSGWRRALATRNRPRPPAEARPDPERRVRPAERPYRTQNQIHENQTSRAAVPDMKSEAETLVTRWQSAAGRASYPEFDRWPSDRLLDSTRSLLAAPGPAPEDPEQLRRALRSFFAEKKVFADDAELEQLARTAESLGCAAATVTARLAACWQPHWRRPPKPAQLREALAGSDGPGRQRAARAVLKTWLGRWEMYRQRLPNLAAAPKVPATTQGRIAAQYPRI